MTPVPPPLPRAAQALLDKEAESLEKDRQLAALQARCVAVPAAVVAALHAVLRAALVPTSDSLECRSGLLAVRQPPQPTANG